MLTPEIDLDFDSREPCPRCAHRLYVREDERGGHRGKVCHFCGWPSSVDAA